ncbi:MAG: amidohydrolase family protein [Chitinophagaceae bacterium]|nr:amidohydrolase family protein [Chitinophagaceae bacterium]
MTIVKTRLYNRLLIAFISTSSFMANGQDVNELKLKDYRPVSIYNIPKTKPVSAKYAAIDMHSHDYAKTDAQVDEWVKMMDLCHIEKTVILSCKTGPAFDSVADKYARYKDRFEIWCGFDYTGMDQPDWAQKAIVELERCYKKGARGVGELGDKGLGELNSYPTPGYGVHIDDPRLKPLIQKCGELNMPINIHIAEDEWMYREADASNDGLMNAAKWKVDLSKEGILNHHQLAVTLENAVRDNPSTIFIAAHLANCCSDLQKLGRLFDLYPNLYADISARYGEIAPVPKYSGVFIKKYRNRLVYGTDMGSAQDMYSTTFRILETDDEHFYEIERFGYHWPLYGFGLSAKTLKKLYSGNAKKIMKRSR